MPIYQCPKCKQSSPIWNVFDGVCENCGYSILDLVNEPSNYQERKFFKHSLGGYDYPDRNWIFLPDVNKETLVKFCAANGSCNEGDYIVLSFDDFIGCNEENPTMKTKWMKLVWFSDSEKIHPYPLDPDKVKNIEWKCKKCGHTYMGELPGICKNCGKHMWIDD